VGHDKASLLMHTEVKDEHGQDLEAIIHNLGITKGQVRFSTHKVPPEQLAMIYDAADCTINISDAEGFGLATLESLSCETPIIVNMTGGLQEQVTDGEEWFGVGIEPKAKAVIGSQQIPFIHEDRITKEDFLDAMMKIYNMTSEERKQLGEKGRQHVLNNYSLEKYEKKWIDTIDHVVEKYGSWETRTGYDSWSLKEV
jgi:glycosyltransferase involved in cell wall biosynthesis